MYFFSYSDQIFQIIQQNILIPLLFLLSTPPETFISFVFKKNLNLWGAPPRPSPDSGTLRFPHNYTTTSKTSQIRQWIQYLPKFTLDVSCRHTNITYTKVNALLVCCRSMQNRNRLHLIMTWIFGGNIPFSQQKNNDSQSIKRVWPASECPRRSWGYWD